MDLQTLIVSIIVGLACVIVIRTFTRQFTVRGGSGCGSCSSNTADAADSEKLLQINDIKKT